jgi:hypothetical protein
MDIFSDLLSWDWRSLLKAAVGAGVGTAAVQGSIAVYQERARKNDNAAYLALRLAVRLEAYASACCSFYFDNANAPHSPDEQYPSWRAELPKVDNFPDDVEAWRALDRQLMARCLNFPNRASASQNAIANCIEHSMRDLENTLDENCSARGLEAWDIASDLRSRYRLNRAEIIFDFRDVLQNVLKASIKEREEQAAAQADLLRELSSSDRGLDKDDVDVA